MAKQQRPLPTELKMPRGTTCLVYGYSAYYFDTVTQESISSQTQTTDHYLENGCLIQDHAVNMPVYYTLSGYIGEKVHVFNGMPQASQYVQRAMLQDSLRRFQTFSQVAPVLSNYIYSAINTGRFIAGRVTKLIKAGQSILKTTFVTDKARGAFENLPETVTGIFGVTKTENTRINADMASIAENRFVTKEQARKWKEFERLRLEQKIMTLYHPYGVTRNVIIERIDCGQDKYITMSNITIVLKQLAFIDQRQVKEEEAKNPFDPASQGSELIKNGNVKTKISDSFQSLKDSTGYYYINDKGERIDLK